jgi:hypothetical protein
VEDTDLFRSHPTSPRVIKIASLEALDQARANVVLVGRIVVEFPSLIIGTPESKLLHKAPAVPVLADTVIRLHQEGLRNLKGLLEGNVSAGKSTENPSTLLESNALRPRQQFDTGCCAVTSPPTSALSCTRACRTAV